MGNEKYGGKGQRRHFNDWAMCLEFTHFFFIQECGGKALAQRQDTGSRSVTVTFQQSSGGPVFYSKLCLPLAEKVKGCNYTDFIGQTRDQKRKC